jgi:ferredoxin
MVSAVRERETMVRLRVDENRCCGAGQCVLVAPGVFDQRDDGVVRLLDECPPKELHAAVRKAVDLCPTCAISLSE